MNKLKLFIPALIVVGIIVAFELYKSKSTGSAPSSLISQQVVPNGNTKVNAEQSPVVQAEDLIRQPLVIEDRTSAEFERENLTTPNDELKLKLGEIEQNMSSGKFIERANSGQLDPSEMQILKATLRLKSALHKILIDRKLKELKGNI